jgi:hypothetical protein
MSSMPAAAGSEDWLAALLHMRAAQVLRAYAVPCLHYAHAQASWRYRLATWTNNNTYGTDRYYCLCSKLGAVVEARIPNAKVHHPEDEFGSPFLIEFGSSALYVYRYGEFKTDSYEGLTLRPGWLRENLVRRGPLTQGTLDFPNLPPIPLSRIAFLAWAGNRATGLERAFFGRPYLDLDQKLCWDHPIEELDVGLGRAFAMPGIDDSKEPPRHSLDFSGIADVEPPPAFGLELLDNDSHFDSDKLFSNSVETYIDMTMKAEEDDIEEGDELEGSPMGAEQESPEDKVVQRAQHDQMLATGTEPVSP